MKALLATWLGVAGTIATAARSLGPFPRIAGASLIWPLYPILIGVSYGRFRWKRKTR